jgi:hypothetical protein
MADPRNWEPDGFYRVIGQHFVAGIEVRYGIVVRTAPILDWLVAWKREWPLHRLQVYALRRGWKVEHLI